MVEKQFIKSDVKKGWIIQISIFKFTHKELILMKILRL